MAKKVDHLEKEEERLEKKLKDALKDDEGWLIVRSKTKVILINEDELKIEPVKKAKGRK